MEKQRDLADVIEYLEWYLRPNYPKQQSGAAYGSLRLLWQAHDTINSWQLIAGTYDNDFLVTQGVFEYMREFLVLADKVDSSGNQMHDAFPAQLVLDKHYEELRQARHRKLELLGSQ